MAQVIEVIGAAELRSALAVLPQKLLGQVMRPALRAAAKVMADGVRHEIQATFDPEGGPGPGHLADTIRVRAQKRKRGSVGMVVLTGTKAELGIPERTRSGDPRGYYPTSLQYGWRWSRKSLARYRRARKRSGTDLGGLSAVAAAEFGTKTIPANPFMTRAFSRSKPAALQVIEVEVNRGLATLKKKAADAMGVGEDGAS